MRNLYILSILLLLAFYGCSETKRKAEVRNDLEKISLTDLKGQVIDLKKYLGKTIFLNVWATWCVPCIHEMPSIENAQQLLNDSNIVFIVASDEEVKEISAFKSGSNFTFNYAIINNPEALNINALPTTFIFNTKGEIKFSEAGVRKWDEEANLKIIRNN